MMKYFSIVSICVLALLYSCDDKLEDRLNDLEERMDQLEAYCVQMNTNILSLHAIIIALENNDFIKYISPVLVGQDTIGYTIGFSDSGPITIYNGDDGINGTNGDTPIVGVKTDTNGTYYWTVNGEWLLDVFGNKIPAKGEDGLDGTTPQLKIIDGRWLLSTDGGLTWDDLGQATGDQGESLFNDVYEDEDGVYFVLSDSTVITIPKQKKLSIEFDDPLDIGIYPGGTATIGYTLYGVTGQPVVKALGQNGWSARVEQLTYSNGEITVKAPDPLVEDEIVVLVYDGEERTIMSSLNFVTGVVTISPNVYYLPPKEGSQEILINTNVDYTIYIPEDATEWLSIDGSKGMRCDAITFLYTANEGVMRFTDVTIINNLDEPVDTLTFVQDGVATEIYVGTPGTISTLISSREMEYLRAIKVSGSINGTDILFVKEMPLLSSLDISELSNTTLPNAAFKNWLSLERLYLPKDLIVIPDELCYGCENLSYLTFPDSAITIKLFAFSSCTGLEGNLEIPNSVESIETRAFEKCGCTGNLIIGSSVKSIGSYAFRNSKFEGELHLNNSITTIGSYAFVGCEYLSGDLIIPNSVITIESFAFAYCRFSGKLVIGDKVISVGTNAFTSCQFRGDLIIGSKVERIFDGAFQDCRYINNVYTKAVIPPEVKTSFPVTNFLGVPYGSIGAYQSAHYWKDFLVIDEVTL